MKFPNHIILEMKTYECIMKKKYWISKQEHLVSFNNMLLIQGEINKFNNYFRQFDLSLERTSMTSFNNIFKKIFNNYKTQDVWNLFNIYFLKKEKIYTKLKYSRVPQYDIVSGGSAALFSGFLGFLICEKFGLELLDSGDFYVLFMYLVFISFFLRLFMKSFSNDSTSFGFFSIKWFYYFYKSLVLLVFFFYC